LEFYQSVELRLVAFTRANQLATRLGSKSFCPSYATCCKCCSDISDLVTELLILRLTCKADKSSISVSSLTFLLSAHRIVREYVVPSHISGDIYLSHVDTTEGPVFYKSENEHTPWEVCFVDKVTNQISFFESHTDTTFVPRLLKLLREQQPVTQAKLHSLLDQASFETFFEVADTSRIKFVPSAELEYYYAV